MYGFGFAKTQGVNTHIRRRDIVKPYQNFWYISTIAVVCICVIYQSHSIHAPLYQENKYFYLLFCSNPKCKVFARKSSISAEELFVLHGVTTDPMGRLCVDIKIPTIKLNIGNFLFIIDYLPFVYNLTLLAGGKRWCTLQGILLVAYIISLMLLETKMGPSRENSTVMDKP